MSDDRPRLTRLELRPLANGTTLAVTPTGRLYTIEADAQEVADFISRFDGTATVEEILATRGLPEAFEEIVDTLLMDGCLTEREPIPGEPSWVRFGGTIDPRRLNATELLLVSDDD